MTILVFQPDAGIVVATADWSVSWENTELTVYDARTSFTCNLQMDLDGFLGLIAEGGKIVDLRKLQEPKEN